jgi:hypothetical protein
MGFMLCHFRRVPKYLLILYAWAREKLYSVFRYAIRASTFSSGSSAKEGILL